MKSVGWNRLREWEELEPEMPRGKHRWGRTSRRMPDRQESVVKFWIKFIWKISALFHKINYTKCQGTIIK